MTSMMAELPICVENGLEFQKCDIEEMKKRGMSIFCFILFRLKINTSPVLHSS